MKAIRVKTRYWRPGTNYVNAVVDAVVKIIQDGDIVTVSEKAISTAKGLVIDESKFWAGRLARFLASFWMRRLWGGPLGYLTKLREKNLNRLRSYPESEGSVHKQVCLLKVGLLQSLRHYSEGGIDASNLPYALVSLPLKDAESCAVEIKEALSRVGKSVSVLIVDGDTTFSWRNLHVSPRHVQTKGLIHIGGFLTFVIGRAFSFKSRSTPISLSGRSMNPDWALTLANVAHRVRGHGAGMTVWDMKEKLGVDFTSITWDMLEEIDHYPIVILKEN